VVGLNFSRLVDSSKSQDFVQNGDIVKSRDPLTGKDESEPVIQLQNHTAPQVVEVHLSDGERITCTPQHPFFVQGKGFEEAGKLSTGDELSEGDEPIGTAAKPALSTVKVDSIVWDAKATTPSTATIVYNFEVANAHTYFVGKEAGGVWVHNNCGLEDPYGVAQQIAKGHAWQDHVLDGNEFMSYGFESQEQFGNFIHNIMTDPDSETRILNNGRMAWWDVDSETIVLYNPGDADLGTAYLGEYGGFLGLK
jgi:hypothetical protein